MLADPKPSAWAMGLSRIMVDASLSQRGTKQLRADIANALDAAREEGREDCHAERDHAEADRRAEAAMRLGLAWGGGNLPPMWDDILDAAKAAGREEGRRAGLEEAAKACRATAAESDTPDGRGGAPPNLIDALREAGGGALNGVSILETFAAEEPDERAAIVAWLRMCGITGDWPDLEPYNNPQDAGREAARIYADEIERGAHYDER